MVPGNDEERRPERAQEGGGALVLGGRVPVGQIAGCDDELGLEHGHERPQIRLHLGLLSRARMKVGHLQDA